MKRLWVALVTASLFVIRMATLLVMLVLQRLLGGAQLRRAQSRPS